MVTPSAKVFMKKEVGHQIKGVSEKQKPVEMSRNEAIKQLFKDVVEYLTTEVISIPKLELAQEAARRWKFSINGTPCNLAKYNLDSLTCILGGLVALLRESHLALETIEKHLGPDQWQELRDASSATHLMEYIRTSGFKVSAKKRHENKRRRSRHKVGEIEEEFGRAEGESISPSVNPYRSGAAEGKSTWPSVDRYQLKAAEPTCLDHVFAGDKVTMLKIEDLFGIGRARFRTILASEEGKGGKLKSGRKEGDGGVYGYVAVLQIMRGLLADNPDGKRSRPRGKPRQGWLQDRELRNRVFNNIERRLTTVRAPAKIAGAFRKLIRENRMESGK